MHRSFSPAYNPALTPSLDVGGRDNFDVSAQEYFEAVEATGATMSAEVKKAINKAVIDLKANSLWTEVFSDLVLLSGASKALYDSDTVKLIGSGTVGNTNFVSGDYDPEAGLTGDLSTKHLDTGFTRSDDQTSFFATAGIEGSSFWPDQRGILSDEAGADTVSFYFRNSSGSAYLQLYYRDDSFTAYNVQSDISNDLNEVPRNVLATINPTMGGRIFVDGAEDTVTPGAAVTLNNPTINMRAYMRDGNRSGATIWFYGFGEVELTAGQIATMNTIFTTLRNNLGIS